MNFQVGSEGAVLLGLPKAVPSTQPSLASWDLHPEAAGTAGGWVSPPLGGCLGDFLSIGKCESGPKISISFAQYTLSEEHMSVRFSKMQM